MTIYGRPITNADLCEIASYMDDATREALHAELAPCTAEEFLAAYIAADPEILPILRTEFDFRQ